MSALLTRAIALPLATLILAAACSDGDGPTQPLRTPTEASAAKQSTKAGTKPAVKQAAKNAGKNKGKVGRPRAAC